MFPIEKVTAVILKCIDQLPQNLARVHNLVAIGSSDKNYKNRKLFLFFLLFSAVHVLFISCSNLDAPLEVQDIH